MKYSALSFAALLALASTSAFSAPSPFAGRYVVLSDACFTGGMPKDVGNPAIVVVNANDERFTLSYVIETKLSSDGYALQEKFDFLMGTFVNHVLGSGSILRAGTRSSDGLTVNYREAHIADGEKVERHLRSTNFVLLDAQSVEIIQKEGVQAAQCRLQRVAPKYRGSN